MTDKHKFKYEAVIEKFELVENAFGRPGLKALSVKGTAAKEVVSRNGVKYLAKELERAAPTLKGRPILKDHKADVDSIVGIVTNSSYDAADKSIQFQGHIMDEKVKELVQNGLINHVSIGASVTNLRPEESADGAKCMVAEGLEILELSVCPVPGIPSASIAPGESFAIALQEAFPIQDPPAVPIPVQPIIQPKKEAIHMEQPNTDALKIAREALADAILAHDPSWKKDELVKLEVNALQAILEKAKTKPAEPKTETPKAEPKGLVKQEDAPKPTTPGAVIVQAGNDNAIKGVPKGTLVVERGNGGKIAFWQMPDYKSQRWY